MLISILQKMKVFFQIGLSITLTGMILFVVLGTIILIDKRYWRTKKDDVYKKLNESPEVQKIMKKIIITKKKLEEIEQEEEGEEESEGEEQEHKEEIIENKDELKEKVNENKEEIKDG